jgi:hypothetical protein
MNVNLSACASSLSSLHSSRLDPVALNPQPLPPREAKHDSLQTLFDTLPLPQWSHPGSREASSRSVRQDADDTPRCPPPPPRPWLDAVGLASPQVLSALGVAGGHAGAVGQDRGIIIIGG